MVVGYRNFIAACAHIVMTLIGRTIGPFVGVRSGSAIGSNRHIAVAGTIETNVVPVRILIRNEFDKEWFGLDEGYFCKNRLTSVTYLDTIKTCGQVTDVLSCCSIAPPKCAVGTATCYSCIYGTVMHSEARDVGGRKGYLQGLRRRKPVTKKEKSYQEQ